MSAEVTDVHTRILRMTLGVEESRAYWANVDPDMPPAARAITAFEQRWFGGRSLKRVRTFLPYLAARYDAYPEALAVLRGWSQMDPAVRVLICHWHLQLSDPLYRRFTGQFLVARREGARPAVAVDVIVRWLRELYPDRWSASTAIMFGSKLLTAATEAGLVAPGREPRALLVPRVPDRALAYLLYLLRGITFEGTLLKNPYLASVGLTDGFLTERLRGLPEVTYHRMGHLEELEWRAPDLAAWAEALPRAR